MPPAARPRRSRARVIIPVVLLLAVLAAAGWLVVRGALAKTELEAILPLVSQAQQALEERDIERLDRVAEDAAEHAARARDLTSDPVWRSLEVLPAVGANAAAVRVIATSVASVAEATRPALAVLAEPPVKEDGSILDLGQIEALRPPLEDAAAAFSDAHAQISDLNPGQLMEPLSGAARDLGGLLGPLAEGLHGAAESARMVPPFLGYDGPRNLLLLVQNPAELRTAGGVTGTYLLLRADAGTLTLVEDLDASAFAPSPTAVGAVPASTLELYGDRVGKEAWNASLSPDFTVTAALARSWWAQRSDVPVDAVISLDPVVLSAVLTTVPPLAMPDGARLDAENVVPALLIEPYVRETEEAQRGYRRDVTTTVITGILRAQPDLLTLAEALAAPLDDGRIAVWSADADEQAVIAESALAGARARHVQAGDGAFSVHLNDATSGKMGTLLQMGIGAGPVSCGVGARGQVAVAVTLTSLATAEAAFLPAGVTGPSNPARPGDIVTDVSVVAPEGWAFGGAVDGGKATPTRDVIDDPFPTGVARVILAPGESRTVTFRFDAPGPTSPEPVLLHTPMVHEVEELPAPTSCG